MSAPRYQIVVVNRLNPKNLIVDISAGLKFVDQQGYLMFSVEKT